MKSPLTLINLAKELLEEPQGASETTYIFLIKLFLQEEIDPTILNRAKEENGRFRIEKT